MKKITFLITLLIAVMQLNAQTSFQKQKEYSNSFATVQIEQIDLENNGNLCLLANIGESCGSRIFAWVRSGDDFIPIQLVDKLFRAAKIATADLNGDLLPDIVVATDDSVYVLTNNGALNFSITTTGTKSTRIEGVSIGDINTDGLLDIVIYGYDGIFALYNTASQNFIRDSIHSYSYNMKLFDVDDDGDLDIVTYNDTALFWLKNLDGAGNFLPSKIAETKGCYADFSIADINDDGLADIEVATKDSVYYFENYAGTFSARKLVSLSPKKENFKIFSFDFDNDGLNDILTVTLNDQDYTYEMYPLVFYKNLDANGSFLGDTILKNHYETINFADINNDGNKDVLLDKYHIGITSQTAQIDEVIDYFLYLFPIYNLFPIDVNNDGYIDFFTRTNLEEFSWVKNYQNEKFEMQRPSIIANSHDFHIIDTVDWNNDGFTDAIISYGYSYLYYLKNNGDETFSITDSIEGSYAFALVADLNNDNKRDLIFHYNKKLYWCENTGDGLFNKNLIDLPPDRILRDIADINGDSYNDFLLMFDDTVSYQYNLYAMLNDGNVHFSDSVFVTNLSSFYDNVLFANLNGDANADIVINDVNKGKMFICINSDAQYPDKTLVDTIIQGGELVIADMNNDGLDDILDFSQKKIYWVHNNNGILEKHPIDTNFLELTYVYAVDMDNDGFKDIITSSESDGIITWYKNNTLQITSQPQSQYDLCDGEVATLTVSAIGADEYQWYKSSDGINFTPLSDDATYSGTHTATLSVVFNVNFVDNFYCHIKNSINTLNSDTVAMYQNYDGPLFTVKDTTLYLDANGSVDLPLDKLVTVISSHCNLFDTTASPSSFSCDNIGITPVEIHVIDVNGSDSSHIAQITVADTVRPQLTVTNTTIYLDDNGNATLSQSDVVTQATDNCGTPTITLSQSDFDCSNIGDNQISVFAMDNAGNVTIKTITVTVLDELAPALTTQNATIYLDDNGSATLAQDDVVSQVSDNCGTPTITLSQTDFGCSDIGDNTVTVTATDAYDNSTIKTVTVTVVDTISPTATTQNATLYLNDNGNATLTQGDVVIQTTDNCGTPTITLSQTDFDCSDIGDNTVTVTVADAGGNSVDYNVNVTIEDTIYPVVVCVENQEVTANENNVYVVNNDEFDPETISDNCGIASIVNDFNNSNTLAGEQFQVGTNTITWTITDENSNISECSFILTVKPYAASIASLTDKDIFIFPNPTAGLFNISANGNITEVVIYDAMGRKILHQNIKSDNTIFDISGYAPGIYTLQITSDTQIIYKKIIKR